MIGTTLSDIRRHIETLAAPTGDYYLVCGRTGDRPVPADGLSFDCRPTARAAATATEQYRTALRRYDPQLPCYDVIVCQRSTAVRSPEDPQCRLSTEHSTVDFCHTVAGVVFETIADSSHANLQSAVMDRYLTLAETIANPDELCLRLIEALATELDSGLSPTEQAAVLRAAADRLSTPSTVSSVDPLEAALDSLQSVSMLEGYAVDCQSVRCASTQWELTLEGYSLGHADRVVTLPLVVECFRRLSAVDLRITGVKRTTSTPPSWRLTLTATVAGSSGPLSVVGVGCR